MDNITHLTTIAPENKDENFIKRLLNSWNDLVSFSTLFNSVSVSENKDKNIEFFKDQKELNDYMQEIF